LQSPKHKGEGRRQLEVSLVLVEPLSHLFARFEKQNALLFNGDLYPGARIPAVHGASDRTKRRSPSFWLTK
jgi:hypothetical protein